MKGKSEEFIIVYTREPRKKQLSYTVKNEKERLAIHFVLGWVERRNDGGKLEDKYAKCATKTINCSCLTWQSLSKEDHQLIKKENTKRGWGVIRQIISTEQKHSSQTQTRRGDKG